MTKKSCTLFCVLFAVISIAMAQPATMTKGQVDNSTQLETDSVCPVQNNRLNVQIGSVNGHGFHHPQHPETGAICPFTETFITNQSYSWYQWETSLPNFGWWTQDNFRADVVICGYLKVTVGDNYGNTGSDSIWFNVKEPAAPLADLIMEIDDDLHPVFSGVATEEHEKIYLSRSYDLVYQSWNGAFELSPGEWAFKDQNATYSDDTLWIYYSLLVDTCGFHADYREIPGLLLNTIEDDLGWCLDMKTILQGNEFHFQNLDNFYCVYYVYTIDQNSHRHHYIDENGDPVILPSETTSWQIPPGFHEHPYYQCGVAKVLDDGTYELLSLSNKVANPYYYEVLPIADVGEDQTYDYCLGNLGDLPFLVVYGDPACPQQSWEWESEGESFSQVGDSIVIPNDHETRRWNVVYHGCDGDVSFQIVFYVPVWEDPFAEPVQWKHHGEAVSLTALDDEAFAQGDVHCLWNTGETANRIEAVEPGPYTVTLSAHGCEDTYAVELRDNVEIDLATIDLKTGRTKVTWQTTEEQAEYIDKVKVVKNGTAYSAPYTQGYYLFSGVEDAPQNYHIVAVSKEGEDCPVNSYERGTVHATYHEDMEGNLSIAWNIPYVEPGASVELTGFQVCKYNPSTEELTVVDEVDTTATHYACSSDLFFSARAVVAALFSNGKRSFANLSHTLAVDEYSGNSFKIYPNPSNGTFTVEGIGVLTITNVLGQTVLTRKSDGQTTIELPQGLYFAKMGNAVRKIVVE